MMRTGFFSFFKTVYAIIFSIIMAILLLSENISYFCKKEFILSNGVIFCIVLMLLSAGVGFYYWAKTKNRLLLKNYSAVNVDKIVLVATVILFFGQCYVFYNVFFLSGWDTWQIRAFVNTIMNGGDKAGINDYFSRYPNNLFISYLFLFLQKINSYFGIFNGVYSYMCVVILNCAINSLSCLLSYKTARIFVSPAFALVAYVFCVFSVGISGWTVICYSDALTLFFPILSVYLYCKQYKNTQMKAVGFIAAGFVSAVGYFIKPQCLFVLIAIVVLEVLKLVGNLSLKKFLRPIALCLAAFIVFSTTNIGINLLNKKYGIQIDKEQSFGFSHFLMMGANEESSGVYLEEDVIFSSSFATAKERNKANINAFKQRISEMKSDLITHLRKKTLVTFNDGTFAWGVEGNFFLIIPENINNKMAPFLKSIYCDGDKYPYFATFQQLIWFFILLCSLLTVVSKKTNCDQYKLSLLWIILLGFVLYEMLFEVRGRYIYIFVPIFCTLAPIGIRNISVLACDSIPSIKKQIERITKK